VTGYAYDVQRTTSLTTPLYPAADGSFTFIETNALSESAFYRAQLTDSDL
jgi:hypothetical protein